MSRDNLERIRRICLALPESFEQEAWGEPTFRVRKRIFVMYAGGGRHGRGRDAIWCNTPAGLQEVLVADEPEKYYVPPYVGVSGWIGLILDELEDEEIESHVAQSYCMVAPKKLQALVGG
jgi:hypothetical protein